MSNGLGEVFEQDSLFFLILFHLPAPRVSSILFPFPNLKFAVRRVSGNPHWSS